ncbi:PGN_0703 family putative restriction endonuclease [Rhodococcus erythropolis]|uniref:PGN_0703 family putative restriction endonuclease n=1 Tax=Rhodococcus erythropolis TaxID=1833 RepID=UPI0011D141FF|nr:hypothetical protein [Rhodococcus erythropolis]
MTSRDASADGAIGREAIGPVAFSESPLASRTRLHQAWYRAAILGIEEYGSSPSRAGPIARGSVLPPHAAEAGKNFMSPDAFDQYRTRRAQGWGVDPLRCTAYMTSSQALTFNLFAPLIRRKDWFCAVLGDLLNIEILELMVAEYEYAPSHPSLALGDKTRLDMWLVLQTRTGPMSVAVEIKYADRFNSRVLPVWDNERYREIREDGRHHWDFSSPAIQSKTINQLLRCHALATFLRPQAHGPHTRLLILHHPFDTAAPSLIDQYAAVVTTPELVARHDLITVFDAMHRHSANAGEDQEVENLAQRYVQFDLSEPTWSSVGLGNSKKLQIGSVSLTPSHSQ